MPFLSLGQVDTLFQDDERKVADIVFKNLNDSLYGPSLLNRAFPDNNTTLSQINGDYSQIHTVLTFNELYEDMAIAYLDSNYLMSPPQLGDFIFEKYEENELDTTFGIDNLIQPFGLLIHNTKFIDTTYMDSSYFSVTNFSINPNIGEDSLYQSAQIKSAALFEFYPDNGYAVGYLKYDVKLISVSPDISNLTIQIDAGNGFLSFDASNPYIEYDRSLDSLIGLAAISYRKGGILVFDTLDFYLTTQGNGVKSKSAETWDVLVSFEASNGVEMLIMHKKGCGNSNNNNDIGKRPIIFAPPYRPGVQPFSANKYWKQFDYKSVMSSLADMGYDIFFIKFRGKYGYASLELNGAAVAEFITSKNIQKNFYYPNEDWENIVSGFSMGGQVARYALLKLESDHMYNGGEHHHSRLYAPFDSPHHSVNIPLFAQAVYKELQSSNLFAYMAYKSLVDEASKDMCYYHLLGSNIVNNGSNQKWIYPVPTTENLNYQSAVQTGYIHPFSHPNDERISFPSFTRNIGISTGNINKDYDEEYSLTPGKLLFKQDALVNFITFKRREVFASKYGGVHTIFRNKESIVFFFPIVYRNTDYRTVDAYEWDMAAGGYKDEFYDEWVAGFIPISPISILRSTGNFWGNKYYDKHMMFLPSTSALAIKPSIWQNNNLFYDLKSNDLMLNAFNSNVNSNTFGYPNLGRPNDHFSITPFEALYCDIQTYEHIKMQKTIDANPALDGNYLVYLRDFVLDEVEADIVCLQNKTIGKNHVQTNGYKYKAWYKAYDQILIGHLVTPKTDPGDYIIEDSGEITVHAGNSITLSPGFHAQADSYFHAYIYYDGCSRPRVE